MIWGFNGLLLVGLLILIFIVFVPQVQYSLSQPEIINSPLHTTTRSSAIHQSPSPHSREIITSLVSVTITPMQDQETDNPGEFSQWPTPTSTLTPFPTVEHTLPSISEGPIIIGYSVENRPLEVFRYGTGNHKRMIVSGIHGGYEWNTIELAHELISYITNNPDVIPPDITLYILPALNPDGEARAHDQEGRANANSVDLNRNWDAYWQYEWPKFGCWVATDITGGAYPASEPETLALMNFLEENSIEALINYHSAALGIFPGGQPPDPASIDLAEAFALISPYPYPPIDTGCQFTGQLIDWASIKNIAAVDIELTNHMDTDLEINTKILHTFLNWEKP